MPDLIPSTELERTFLQACEWETSRIWQRICLSAKREQWNTTAALTVCLLLDYAECSDFDNVNWTIESLDSVLNRLNSEEKHSLFKVCQFTLERIQEDTDPQDCFPFVGKLIESINLFMSRILLTGDVQGIQRLEMNRVLHKLFDGESIYKLVARQQKELERSTVKWGEESKPYVLPPFRRMSLTPFVQELNEKLESTTATYREPEQLRTLSPSELATARARNILQSELQSSVGTHGQAINYVFSSNYFAQAEVQSSIVTESQSKRDRLDQITRELAIVTDRFGLRSEEAAHALVKVADLMPESALGLVPLSMYLAKLAMVLTDESIPMSPYDLRRVYCLSGKLKAKVEYIELSEQLQSTVVARRLKMFGNDMTMTLPMTRLIELWYATGRLEEGEAFCKSLLKFVTSSYGDDDILALQVKSICERVTRLRCEQSDTPQGKPIVLSESTEEEPDEFLVMLSIIAFDHAQNGRTADAEDVLKEAIAYYRECGSETARRVGEMLWLLMETDLRHIKPFRIGLIEASIEKAFDEHLRTRFIAHLRRLIRLLLSKEASVELIEHAITVSGRKIKGSDLDVMQWTYWSLVTDELNELSARLSSFSPTKASVEFNKLLEQPNLSKVHLPKINELVESIAESAGLPEELGEAKLALQRASALSSQTRDDLSKLLTRMARLHISDGNICDATAILHSAFVIPAPYGYDPESDLLLLPAS